VRWRPFTLRAVRLEGEPDPGGESDHWLTCLLCEQPTRGDLAGKRPSGKPVEYTVTLLGDGQVRGFGLHLRCLEKMERWQEKMAIGEDEHGHE